ncbi:unnamed protein product [Cuscuta campestris]|uniref:Zeta toxin domain-containing protein n=1 Tax=Cuscuta campestris TaxID=132261 RepID=A0A484LYZ5_9ASTE|nr:unnamed protein product [Cuscuta campestris]
MAMEATKLLYVVVVDGDDGKEEKNSFRYTRSVLQSTLQLMGCKARHAFKISQRVLEEMKSKYMNNSLDSASTDKSEQYNVNQLVQEENYHNKNEPFELYKKRTTVVVRRKTFIDVICDALTEYKYVGTNQRADLTLACRIRERKESITILLCGTSGCGKSTLSALLGSRLGITNVISTDSIRHMMRSFVSENQNPLLWASTYHAGEYLDPVAVAEAKAKRKAKKLAGYSTTQLQKNDGSNHSTNKNYPAEGSSSAVDLISPKQMAIEGFKAQSEMVIDSLDRLITAWEERKESVVVEGVHLSLNFVMGLMKKHPSIIPFMVFIANEEKHLERFAVRAKYMTLDPAKNKYVKYIRNIRTIQEYLCNRADKHLVPKINNTNVDRSVASIHATVFGCLRRRSAGEKLYDPMTNTVPVVDEEYRNQSAANSLSSKGMFQLIQRKGSSRHLMALFNNDGSVAKTWPVDSIDSSGKPITDSRVGMSVYEPLQIGKAEPVNLQFGYLGISAWLGETGCTSHASSVDESKGDFTDNGSRYYSSCCSSPRFLEGISKDSKELKEEQSVHGSDEELSEPPEMESDEDLSDDSSKRFHEELEGSVDEEYTKSDEEYDDLAMLDVQQNGDIPDNDERFKNFQLSDKVVPVSGDQIPEESNDHRETEKENTSSFCRTKSETFLEPSLCCNSFQRVKNEKRVPCNGSVRIRKRSLSIPSLSRHRSMVSNECTLPNEFSR